MSKHAPKHAACLEVSNHEEARQARTHAHRASTLPTQPSNERNSMSTDNNQRSSRSDVTALLESDLTTALVAPHR